jgi:hypothetical protein
MAGTVANREVFTPLGLAQGRKGGVHLAEVCLTALYGLAALVTLTVAWLPIELTIPHFLHDDFFYALKLAQNVLDRGTISFDGTSPTNAPLPMWLGVCMGAEAVCGPMLAIHAVLTVAAFLHLLQAYLVFHLLAATCSRTIAHLATFFYLFNFRVIACNLCGLEAPLQGFMVLLVFYFLLRCRKPLTGSSAAGCGLLLGLAAMTRLDLILLGAILIAWLLLDRALAGGGFRARVRLSATLAGTALAVVSPWVIRTAFRSGSLLPSTLSALNLFKFQQFHLRMPLHYNLEVLRAKLSLAGAQLSDTANLFGLWPFIYAHDFDGRLCGVLIVALLAAITCGMWLTRHGSGHVLRCVLFAYALTHMAYYFTFAVLEMRYLFPFCIAVVVVAASTASDLLQRFPGRLASRRMAGLYAIVIVNAAVAGGFAWFHNQGAASSHALNIALYDMARWIRMHTDERAVIGSWNGGILGYFSGRTVVNLDGLVNDEAIAAMRERRLASYIRQRNINYLADVNGQIEMFMRHFSGQPRWRDDYELAYRGSSTTAMRRKAE